MLEVIKSENDNLKTYMLKLEENFKYGTSLVNQSYETKDSDINRSIMQGHIEENSS